MKGEVQLGQGQPVPQYQQGNQSYPQQGNQGYPQQGQVPQQIVVVNQTVIEPPCCGTLCVSINDFFWLWGPTGLGFVVGAEKPGLIIVWVLGLIAHILAIVAAVSSCGLPSSGKVGFLTFYKWFRLAWFILYLIGAIIVIIVGIIVMGTKTSNGVADTVAKALGILIIILGIIISIPGIVMASTHGCFTRDLQIKNQAVGTGTPSY